MCDRYPGQAPPASGQRHERAASAAAALFPSFPRPPRARRRPVEDLDGCVLAEAVPVSLRGFPLVRGAGAHRLRTAALLQPPGGRGESGEAVRRGVAAGGGDLRAGHPREGAGAARPHRRRLRRAAVCVRLLVLQSSPGLSKESQSAQRKRSWSVREVPTSSSQALQLQSITGVKKRPVVAAGGQRLREKKEKNLNEFGVFISEPTGWSSSQWRGRAAGRTSSPQGHREHHGAHTGRKIPSCDVQFAYTTF